VARAILFTQLSRFRPTDVIGIYDRCACLQWWHQARILLLPPEHTDGNSKVSGGSDNCWASECLWTYSSSAEWVAILRSGGFSMNLAQPSTARAGENWVCRGGNTACRTMSQICTQLYWCQVSAVVAYSKNLGSAIWRAILVIGVCDGSSGERITTTLLPGLGFWLLIHEDQVILTEH